MIQPRADVNAKFYGTTGVAPRDILNGNVEPPVEAADFYNALAAGMSDQPPRHWKKAAEAGAAGGTLDDDISEPSYPVRPQVQV